MNRHKYLIYTTFSLDQLYQLYRWASRTCFTYPEAREEMDIINSIIDKKLEGKKEKRGPYVWP